jgi:predicted Rdx family selenoprotein
MKLPLAPTGKTPTRSPTDEDVAPAILAKLGLDLEEAFEEAGGPIGTDVLVQLASDRGKAVGEYYAAAALAADIELAATQPIQLVFCAGTCQRWGAIGAIDRAVAIWERKADKGAPGFDVLARRCLDRCDQAAVCEIRTPDGTSVLTQVTPASIEAALAELLP